MAVSSSIKKKKKSTGRQEVCGIYSQQIDTARDPPTPEVPFPLCSFCVQQANSPGMFGDFSQAFLWSRVKEMQPVTYLTDTLVFTPPQGELVVKPMCDMAQANKQILS